ncbi:MAG: TadE/TadG family type IV pilus assembly protein [Roseovarius pacificus]|nr:TadE/TadG family type IV pilus assembly protein [Roseovarius pacificus]
MIRFLRNRLARFRRDDGGNASIEFVIIVPVFIALLVFSIELSLITLRHALLERGLDLTVRQIRLGYAIPPITPRSRTWCAISPSWAETARKTCALK